MRRDTKCRARLEHNAGDSFAAYRQPYLHGKIAIALNEIFGAVHRVDEPHAFFLQAVVVVDGFFGEDAIVRKLFSQAAND